MKKIFLLCILLAGCGVTQTDFEEAKRLCEPHEGVRWLYPAQFGFDQLVTCRDSMRYKFETKEKP